MAASALNRTWGLFELVLLAVPAAVAQLTALGFSHQQATQALAQCGGNAELAARQTAQ
mgnify:CR=1 FL=1